ncbi:MAG: GNAT family N-acetyltransferase [Acidimicrobiales bacterium]
MSSRPLDIRPDRLDSPAARQLIAALDGDLDARYAADADVEGEPDRALLDVLSEHVAPPLGAFLIAWVGDEPVGCGAVRPLGGGGTCEIKRMYVVPAMRGTGAGIALLAALEARARELGYRRVMLETGIRQPEAMALYERAGYRAVENYGAYRTSPLSRCYAKDLRPAADS